jgi:hypothetical protein
MHSTGIPIVPAPIPPSNMCVGSSISPRTGIAANRNGAEGEPAPAGAAAGAPQALRPPQQGADDHPGSRMNPHVFTHSTPKSLPATSPMKLRNAHSQASPHRAPTEAKDQAPRADGEPAVGRLASHQASSTSSTGATSSRGDLRPRSGRRALRRAGTASGQAAGSRFACPAPLGDAGFLDGVAAAHRGAVRAPHAGSVDVVAERAVKPDGAL